MIDEEEKKVEKDAMEKALLNVEEMCSYLGIGKTKARELLKMPGSTFAVKIGNRWYANKRILDIWLEKQSGTFVR